MPAPWSTPPLPALQELATTREQLEQVKQEKVEALMKLAAGGGGSPARTRSDSAKGDDGEPSAHSLARDSLPQKKGAGGWWSSPVKG